ncbi:MAG TPA: ABC transporter permease [Gaiellaceae bacterium]|jgi:peptide/nickel transport system permease protein
MSTLDPHAIPDLTAPPPPATEDDKHEIHALGYWESVWRVFKRDKVAIVGGITILLLFLVSFAGAPIAQHFLGHDGNTPFLGGTTADNGAPIGPWAHVSQLPGNQGPKAFFILGADSLVGRDEFLRLLYGGQTSLEIAVFATIFATILGLLMGAAAGYFGGVTDTLISRLTELVMAFPVLLFIIGLAEVAGTQLRGITLGFLPQGVFLLTTVFVIFGWFYPARIARAQILSLREKEFVEAARMTGASDWRIIRSHLLPHLVAPMIVIATLSVGGFVLAEAGLSFLGIGITDPTSSWGQLLELSLPYYRLNVFLLLWPGLMVLITTLSFNLLGDGLRDAFDPRTAN